jgi:DNA polymerase-4/DNA polymerase V
MSQFSVRSFPQAIVHIDADAFFASCEQATKPHLKGKPVVTGKERGIASAASYEAKARGVTRGMSVFDVKRVCPEAVLIPSDYEMYSLFSKRMFAIVRRYTPEVEEYSIDECFADITGMRRVHRMSYERIAGAIKHDLERELGMTFSVGMAPTKTLAKVASTWHKPSGFLSMPAREAHLYLAQLPVDEVWGIGGQTASYLRKHGLETALVFANANEHWVREHLSKPFRECWCELRGQLVHPIETESDNAYQSISKTKTFTPPSSDEAFVFAQLSKNIENACIKLRRHQLAAGSAVFFLKRNDFQVRAVETDLPYTVATPHTIIAQAKRLFKRVYKSGETYRSTGVILSRLTEAGVHQRDLFGADECVTKEAQVYEQVDALSKKYGKHAVFLGSSMQAINGSQHRGGRGEGPKRHEDLMKGESKRQRIGIPLLGDVD